MKAWPPSRRAAVAPALVAGGLLFALNALPGVRLPGQRGGTLIAEGFRPGRWDARFVVARGNAAFQLPAQPLRLLATLSGPARVTLAASGRETKLTLTAEPSRVSLALPAGGRVEIEPDATVRLHEIEVERSDGPPWRHLAALALATALAAALAAFRPGLATLALSLLLTLGVGLPTLQGSLSGLIAAALWRRLLPLLALALAASTFLLLRAVPKQPPPSAAPDPRLPALFGALVLVSCLTQAFWFPQPLLIGDPAAYHEIGGRFRDALLAVRSPDDVADAMQELRPYAGLAVTGLVYGLLRALLDRLATIYVAQSLAVAAAIFFTVRAALRLRGRPLAVAVGLLALSYGTFPVLVGQVQPEPFLLMLWGFAFDAWLAAEAGKDARGAARAGLAFALGLALHPQGLWFLLAAFGIVLAPFARSLWLRERRALVRGFGVGLLPVVLITAAGESWARPVTPVLDERHGFWAYTASFPLGFWLFLDTDGWQGPERIDDTRYARELRDALGSGAVAGRLGQLRFTAEFVAANAPASLRTVLRNGHRLFHQPDNPPRRDFPLPYPLQQAWHRTLVVLALLGVAVALPGAAAPAYLPFAMLSTTYPLYHVFNKYAVPATPFLLLGAALALARLQQDRRLSLRLALAAAGLGATLPPAALAFADVPVGLSRAIVLALHLGGLAAAFVLVGRDWTRAAAGRLLTATAGLALLLPSLAAEWGDPGWRDFHVALDRPAEHEIALAPEDVAALSSAREAYLALDLLLPDGDPRPLELAFESGLVVPGAELQPCMPSFGLASVRFHRDPRTFRQWWRLGWRPEMASTGRVRLTLRGGRGAWLYGSLGDTRAGSAVGLSLGQWPYLSVYRLMHDGEYRLTTEQPFSGTSRASRHAGETLPGLLGIRLVRLADETSVARVETAPAPRAARAVVTAVWARTSSAGDVELELPGEVLRFRLGERGIVAGRAGPYPAELRFSPTGEDEGWYLLRTTAPPGVPLRLGFVPRQEMASPPRVVAPQLRAANPPLPLDWVGSPYLPVVKILESRGDPWRPAAVY